jgi:hypothetical protein
MALLAWERIWDWESCGRGGGADSGAPIQGTPSWSWLPPGVSCDFEIRTTDGIVEFREDPPLARTGIVVVLLLWGATIAAVAAVPSIASSQSRRPPAGSSS